jgi:hypothetical protein
MASLSLQDWTALVTATLMVLIPLSGFAFRQWRLRHKNGAKLKSFASRLYVRLTSSVRCLAFELEA